jgi:hypothetical protein
MAAPVEPNSSAQPKNTAPVQNPQSDPKIMDAKAAQKAAQEAFLKNTAEKIGAGCPACGAG